MPDAPPTLDASSALLKAFADPIRLRLLNLLGDGRAVCVCHLHEALGLPQPTVSRHLAVLRESRLVAATKRGLWVYYRLADPETDLHRTLLGCVAGCLGTIELLREDRRRLDRVVPCCDRP